MAGYVVPRVELDELATLDSGTFGRTYHTHLMKNGLSPFRVDDQLNEQMRRCLFSMRYRVMHDVIHVLTGFDTSYAGEVGVLAFAVSQRYCRIQKLELGMALMMAPAMTPAGLWTVYRNARLGRQLGRSADFLLNYRFEEDLRLPLDEVIEKVGLDRLDRAA
jgi:ubiquinone biosynthesis protein Coq4